MLVILCVSGYTRWSSLRVRSLYEEAFFHSNCVWRILRKSIISAIFHACSCGYFCSKMDNCIGPCHDSRLCTCACKNIRLIAGERRSRGFQLAVFARVVKIHNRHRVDEEHARQRRPLLVSFLFDRMPLLVGRHVEDPSDLDGFHQVFKHRHSLFTDRLRFKHLFLKLWSASGHQRLLAWRRRQSS